MITKRRRRLPHLVVGLALVAVVAGPAGSTFPGQNGKIVFVGEDNELYKVEPNGSNLDPITDTTDAEIDPAISPGGGRIAFSRSAGMGQTQIFIVKMNGEGERRITRGGNAVDPTWTPSGKSIVFTRNTNTGGYDLFKVRIGPEPRFGRRLTETTGFELEPEVSADGLIVFTFSVGKGQGELVKMHLDGNGRRRITDTSKRLEQSPTWAPGGNRVAFSTAVLEKGATPDIATIHADGTHRMRLVDRPNRSFNSPSWSPNGEWIAAIARNESFEGKVVRFPSDDGSPLIDVTTFAEPGIQPAWQPN
jgi:dipeptidyl aminopeptidase/acylaminoacyl peptidase